MKRHLPLAALLVLAFATFCFAQPQATASPSPSPAAKPKPKMSKAQLMKKLSANETALWNAWKNKDTKPFQMWLAADGVSISEQGLGTKADLIKELPSMPCEVKSFTLSDWKLSMVDADAATADLQGRHRWDLRRTSPAAGLVQQSLDKSKRKVGGVLAYGNQREDTVSEHPGIGRQEKGRTRIVRPFPLPRMWEQLSW